MRLFVFSLLFLIALPVSLGGKVAAQDVSIGGFIPFVGIGLTDEFQPGDGLNATFFIAEREDSLVGTPLSGGATPFHDIALLDTGAATHILTPFADGPNGFDISGNGFGGTNIQPIGGATGIINLEINDPHAIFAAGLGDRTSDGSSLQINPAAFRGQSSVATLSAPAEWTLPNIIGLPLAAQHAIAIRNDDPQIFELGGRTVRTPQVDFIPLGTGDQQGIQRRLNLKITPGIGFVQGPIYVQDVTGILSGDPFHENPLSPSVIENGALLVDVDARNGADEIQDKEFLFDTGADFTVISTFTAARLGIDPILDTPDFVLEVEGSGGVQGGVPGFFVEELSFDTVGGDFVLNNVPVAVLDVTNPTDPGNIIDGIIGMHLFNGRNLVIDANPSIGQGGAGPTIYIGDPVTNQRTWDAATDSRVWESDLNWQENAQPDQLSDVLVTRSVAASPFFEQVFLDSDASVYRMTVAGNEDGLVRLFIESGRTLTTYGETRIDDGGQIEIRGGKLDAQFININGGLLTGEGEIFAGTGPIFSAVRNLAGTVAPGPANSLSGTLSIDGDYSMLEEATLRISLTNLLNVVNNDLLEVTRFAFLAGTLEVNLIERSSDPLMVGDMFTILTADEGVFGEFDQLILPSEFAWDVSIFENSVVLEIIGVGLPGDFNTDGVVNAADYTVWRDGLGTIFTQADYIAWRDNYGATSAVAAAQSVVPEPSALLLIASALSLCAASRKR